LYSRRYRDVQPRFPAPLRIRVGKYRILYRIRDWILLVLVVRIGDRKEIYRSLADL